MPKASTKAAKRRARKPLKPARKISDRQLLIHWTHVLQSQQLWIAQIIQSLGAPLLPGDPERIRQNLSREHFKAWLDEGVPLSLIEGLFWASNEESSVRKEIAGRLTGEVVSRLIDVRAEKVGRSDSLSDNLREIQRAFMVDRIKAKQVQSQSMPDDEDARSDAFLDAWNELDRQAESLITTSWPLPTAESAFEADLYVRWQTDVLSALKKRWVALLPVLVGREALNYVPARIKMDQIDRARSKGAKKRKGVEVEYDQKLHEEPLRSTDDNSEETKVLKSEGVRKRLKKLEEATDGYGPETVRAIQLILREGYNQKKAAEAQGIPESTLSERIIKIREKIEKSEL